MQHQIFYRIHRYFHRIECLIAYHAMRSQLYGMVGYLLYHVRVISYNSRIYAENPKTPPLCSPAPLRLCCLNDKSFTGHDITSYT